ncbi:MAG: hypothetical protein ABI867_16650 [Kofleriaceae bacterium]
MVATRAAVPAGRLGFIGNLVEHGAEVYGFGGTYYAPTVLRSVDAGVTFEAWKPPDTAGLRDGYVDGKAVWVVGEFGWIGRTANRGKQWSKIPGAESECLYTIVRDAGGRFWISGDRGLVLRGRTRANREYDRIKTATKGRVLSLYLDPKDGQPWALDSTGVLQRWTGKRFTTIEVKALRTKVSLNRMVRTPAGTLIVVANGGKVLRSTTDGAAWKTIPIRMHADLETIAVTRYGLVVAGDGGTLLISHDDGASFDTLPVGGIDGHLWSIANVAGAILVGGDAGTIYRVAASDLAALMHDTYASTDATLAALAARVRDGDDGAEMVLEDALRERGRWV